jgi:hypothetical protein
MTEELFPAAKTLIDVRIGPVDIRYTLARTRDGAGDGAWREYLWLIDVDQEAVDTFPTDLGEALKARLAAFGARLFSDFDIVGTAEQGTTTPNVVWFSETDPDTSGWIGPWREMAW